MAGSPLLLATRAVTVTASPDLGCCGLWARSRIAALALPARSTAAACGEEELIGHARPATTRNSCRHGSIEADVRCGPRRSKLQTSEGSSQGDSSVQGWQGCM